MSQTANDYEQQLRLADQIKTSDNQQFSQILTDIEAKFERLSIPQKYLYLYLSGYQNAYKGDLKKAISLYKHVEQNSRDEALRFKASFSLINLYALKKDWSNGFVYLDNIAKLNEKISDINVRHQGLVVAALFYNELEQYEMAQIYVRRLLAEQVTGRNLCLLYSVKLRADLFSQQLESLVQDIGPAIESCDKASEPVIVNVLRTYLASYHLAKNEPDKILSVLEAHYEEIQKSNYELLKIETSSLLSQAYLQLGNYDKAKKHAQDVIKEKDSNEYVKSIVSAYNTLSTIARKKQQYDQSFEYHDKYITYKEFEFEQSKAKQLAIEMAKFQAIEKDNQIKLLNKQNQILNLETELSRESAVFNRWLIAFLIIVAAVMVMWVYSMKRSQQRLKYLAEYDSLTEISNRAFFTQSAEAVLSYFTSSKRPVCLILFDLDHFKKVNDTYGHLIGDEVLKLAANACKGSVRKIDIFGRIGGEEFAILLPGCELDHAIRIAEECRLRISEIDTTANGHDFEVSASFGVSDSSACGYLLKDLLSNADEAMYIAKRRGRNRVVSHSGE